MKNFLKEHTRAIICLALVLVIFGCFIARLINWQLLNGSYYKQNVATAANYRLTSAPTRGEILDRNGVALKSNKTTYNVIIDKLFIPEGMTENEIIETLLSLFDSTGAPWVDMLPIHRDENGVYQFRTLEDTKEHRSALNYLKSEDYLGLGIYADAQEYINELYKRYELEGIEDESLRRNVASVRFNMERNLYSYSDPYVFARDIDEKMMAVISELSQDLPCIDISTSSERYCEDGTLMPHILGNTGALTAEEYDEYKDKGYSYNDTIGKFGIEASMEDYLRGEGGVKTIKKTSTGANLGEVEIIPAKPGNTVFLTIDRNLQTVANDALERNVKAAREWGIAQCALTGDKLLGEDCVAGAVVMLDVRDFSVLAAATYPSYDLNQYSDSDYYSSLIEDKNLPLYDRAFMGSFAPGSVVKPAVSLGALEEGVITEYTPVTCTRRYDYYPDNVVNCMGTHGDLDVTGAITRSCNYFFADVGRRLGIDTMALYMEKLGLGVKTGLEITESKGFLAGRDSVTWVPGNTVQAAIGQSDNTFTPVQLATYCATIANDGVRLRTHLVSKITSYDKTEVIMENTPENAEVVEDLSLTPYNVTVVQHAMRQVVLNESGTAHNMFSDYPIAIAAKTGTAENTGSDHTAFICYAPYDDPQVAIAVVIEHGARGTFSMDVAKSLLDAYFFPETLETEPTEAPTAPIAE